MGNRGNGNAKKTKKNTNFFRINDYICIIKP